MVKIREFEHFLIHIHRDLFNFAFALIPDDLQAEQIVLDSIHVLVLNNNEVVKNMLIVEEDIRTLETLKEIKRELMKSIYNLSKKRFQQIKSAINFDGKYSPFYLLDSEEKAILYLKQIANLSLEELEVIIDKDKYHLISRLNSARNNLAYNLGIEFPPGL